MSNPPRPPYVGKKELLEGHAAAHPSHASFLGVSRQEVDNNSSLRVSCGGARVADRPLFGMSTRRSGREVAVRGAVLPGFAERSAWSSASVQQRPSRSGARAN
ncbi:hypothetical protein HOK021_54840 [Streptomyces hygroscopicus]|nr:hypothetical protein HOK021_54840 [Streptomyces hygroscopicus]